MFALHRALAMAFAVELRGISSLKLGSAKEGSVGGIHSKLTF